MRSDSGLPPEKKFDQPAHMEWIRGLKLAALLKRFEGVDLSQRITCALPAGTSQSPTWKAIWWVIEAKRLGDRTLPPAPNLANGVDRTPPTRRSEQQ